MEILLVFRTSAQLFSLTFAGNKYEKDEPELQAVENARLPSRQSCHLHIDPSFWFGGGGNSPNSNWRLKRVPAREKIGFNTYHQILLCQYNDVSKNH